jgi:hypothetical protein
VITESEPIPDAAARPGLIFGEDAAVAVVVAPLRGAGIRHESPPWSIKGSSPSR